MGDLADKFLKAGLVTAEQAKKATTPPPRPPRKDAPPQQQSAPQSHAPQHAPQPSAPLDDELKQRLRSLAHGGKVDARWRGQRRWYYVSRRGVVPFIEINDEAAQALEQGGAALAEAPNGEAWLVTGECAHKLRALHADGAREWLRVWNGR